MSFLRLIPFAYRRRGLNSSLPSLPFPVQSPKQARAQQEAQRIHPRRRVLWRHQGLAQAAEEANKGDRRREGSRREEREGGSRPRRSRSR
jgi:hypothetical protein